MSQVAKELDQLKIQLIPIGRNKTNGSQNANGFEHAGMISKVDASTYQSQRLLVAQDLHQPMLNKQKYIIKNQTLQKQGN